MAVALQLAPSDFKLGKNCGPGAGQMSSHKRFSTNCDNEFDVLCRFRSSQAGRQTRTVGKGMRDLVRRCS